VVGVCLWAKNERSDAVSKEAPPGLSKKGLWRSEGAGYFGNRRLWVRLRPTAIRSKAAVVAQE